MIYFQSKVFYTSTEILNNECQGITVEFTTIFGLIFRLYLVFVPSLRGQLQNVQFSLEWQVILCVLCTAGVY